MWGVIERIHPCFNQKHINMFYILVIPNTSICISLRHITVKVKVTVLPRKMLYCHVQEGVEMGVEVEVSSKCF